MYIRAEVEVRPTEDLNKVLKSLSTIVRIDSARIEDVGRGYRVIVIESTDITALKPLYEGLRRQRILDTAREYMYKHRSGEMITIMVNKQAAYQGYISFVESPSESPLGPIIITISSPLIDKVIDWIAPRTAHGKPLWEVEPPRNA